nr:CHAT domain-containing protein [Synechococcus sp. CS-1328]
MLQQSGLSANITPRGLDVEILPQSKVYDGTTSAMLRTSDYQLMGFVGGEDATITNTSGAYDSANVFEAGIVTAALEGGDFSAGDGTLLSNYQLPVLAEGVGTITTRSLSTWLGSEGGLWSDSSNWDVLPAFGNVDSVFIGAGSGSIVYDSSAGFVSLQTLNIGGSLSISSGSLAISGATEILGGGSLSVLAGVFSTAEVLNSGNVRLASSAASLGSITNNGGGIVADSGLQVTSLNLLGGTVSGSGPLAVTDSYSQSGGLISGFDSVSINQANGDLSLTEGEILAPGGSIALYSNSGSLLLESMSLDASGAANGGLITLDGAKIDILNSNVNTSGADDGGTILIGGVASGVLLPDSVIITDSKLVADPPAAGGNIAINGSAIDISSAGGGGTVLNIFGSSGGSLTIGSSQTNSIFLDSSTLIQSGPGGSIVFLASSPGGIVNSSTVEILGGSTPSVPSPPVVPPVSVAPVPTPTPTPPTPIPVPPASPIAPTIPPVAVPPGSPTSSTPSVPSLPPISSDLSAVAIALNSVINQPPIAVQEAVPLVAAIAPVPLNTDFQLERESPVKISLDSSSFLFSDDLLLSATIDGDLQPNQLADGSILIDLQSDALLRVGVDQGELALAGEADILRDVEIADDGSFLIELNNDELFIQGLEAAGIRLVETVGSSAASEVAIMVDGAVLIDLRSDTFLGPLASQDELALVEQVGESFDTLMKEDGSVVIDLRSEELVALGDDERVETIAAADAIQDSDLLSERVGGREIAAIVNETGVATIQLAMLPITSLEASQAFAAGEQNALDFTAAKLGLGRGDRSTPVTVEEVQSVLQQVARATNYSPYRPAALRLSFTTNSSELASSDTGFLDVTLVPAQGEVVGRRVVVNTRQFGDQLKKLYSQLAKQESMNVEDPQSPSRQLYDVLIAPVAKEMKQLGVTTLLLSADAGLQAIPFAALHDGTAYLAESIGMSLTPSIGLMPLDVPPAGSDHRQLRAGASQFEGLAPLPLVPQELERLSQAKQGDSYLNAQFSPQVLLEQAGDASIKQVHVATHAEFLPGGPSKSRLFTGTGPLSLAEFAFLRQRRQGEPLELFSLSACRTALGDRDSELGFAGLALQAGSRSAIGTLWYVDDVATSAFFVQFYRYLDAGLPKAEALQAAKRDFASGTVKLQGDQVVGVDGVPLLSGLTAAQQRRVVTGMQHPYFWGGIGLLGTPW